MVRAGYSISTRLAAILGVGLALAGCQMTGGDGVEPATMAATQPAAQSPGPGQRVIERDVEAPDVFQIEEPGLWDGRPSLGGVWVAHPSASDPERVLIRNTTTGTEVIGALFRRERDNPGPRFQISSEAANALNILPGAPTAIEVTALRLQRIEMEIDPAPVAEEEPAATAADETLVLAPVEPGETAAPESAPETQVAITEEEPRRRGFLGLFARRERDPEPEIAQTTLEPAETVAETASAAGQVTTQAAAAGTAAGTAAVTATAESVEPRRERGGFLGLFRRREPEPEPDTTLIALPGIDANSPTAAPQRQPQPQPQTSGLDRPFVQIGIFSVEQNAVNARNRMQVSGLMSEIRRGRVGDNLFWRVVVGPAMTSNDRTQILRQVRQMGFGDAYAVVR